MQLSGLVQAEQYRVMNNRRRLWQRLVVAMACIVVFCTTYALILPAITMTSPRCGLEEHAHSAECWQQEPSERSLACSVMGEAAVFAHVHNELCYNTQGELLCALEEKILHTHTDECYTAHEHTEICFESTVVCPLEETEEHTHGDDCYEIASEPSCDEKPVLSCGREALQLHRHDEVCLAGGCVLPEVAEHTHDEACFVAAEPQLTCTVADEEHDHSERCFGEWKLICSIEEHKHSDVCYADRNADVETREDWEKTLPELSGVWTDDVVAVAKSQMGYCESTINYEVAEDGMHMGYTRYGEWYGNPYGDWCAMFASFCLYYAGVEEMPLEASCSRWVSDLQEEGLYADAAYLPSAGDVVFIDNDGDAVAEHVGVVSGLSGAEGDASVLIHVIEGNSCDRVELNSYDAVDTRLVGFGRLPAMPLTDEEQAAVDYVIGEIEALPSSDEIDSTVITYEKSGDDEGLNTWYAGVVQQVNDVYRAYNKLSENQKAYVVNADKLLDLEYIWSSGLYDAASGMERFCGYNHEHDLGECICAVKPHNHSAACYSDGTDTPDCGLEEHTHGSACCILLTHEHSGACHTVGTFYCDKVVHVHDRECFDDSAKLTCKQYQHVHHAYCEQLPLEFVAEQNSISGVYYSMKNLNYSSQSLPMYYQVSSHMLNNGSGNVACFAYVLVSDELVTDSRDTSWQPNLVHWSAKADANYLVAYCAEPYTSTANGGAQYSSFTIDDSRFTSDMQRRNLAGVISHAYPYLTYAEMKAELREAYLNGELTYDIANCPSCTENEYLASTQAALWALIDPVHTYSNFSSAIDTVGSSAYLNPHTGELKGYVGHSDDTNLDQHCNAIKTWLMKQMAQEPISVAACDYEIEKTEYNTYHLKVLATLSRGIIFGEEVTAQLVAGNVMSEVVHPGVSEDSITLELRDITEEELVNAGLSLHVSGEQLQAYFFNSSTYQDFISGLWEDYEDDLSFRLGIDATDVSVVKEWADGVPEEVSSVSVQLYANGEKYGEPVVLSAKNDWRYTWSGLMKKDLTGKDIEYTVQEKPVEGYYSVITPETAETVTVRQWVKVGSFREGGQYLIIGSDGALGVHTFASHPALTWEFADLSLPNAAEPGVIWHASSMNEDGGVLLSCEAYPDVPLGINSSNEVAPDGTLIAQAAPVYYNGANLYMHNSSGAVRYFSALYDEGEYRTDSSKEKAAAIALYELQTIEVPAAEIGYVLTNTKIEPEIEKVSFTVTKQWNGRPDEVYPEAAVVYLTQNGNRYGSEVILNAENDWSYRWDELPKTDNEGVPFVYSVEEKTLADYIGEVVLTTDDNGQYAALLKNTWTPEKVDVVLHKTNIDGSRALPGAVFDLYMVTDHHAGVVLPKTNGVSVYGVKLGSVSTGEDGRVELKDLASGESYYLVETKAPSGYSLLSNSFGFSVEKRGEQVIVELITENELVSVEGLTEAVITVKNNQEFLLPETGGIGRECYIIGGFVLMLGAVLCRFVPKYRGRENA